MRMTEFLLARFDEDEALAGNVGSEEWGGIDVWGEAKSDFYYLPDGGERWPARVLAECDAKRRLLDLHKEARSLYEERNDMPGACAAESSWAYFTDGMGTSTRWPCQTVKLLALPYADHPDYDPEWRP